MRPEKAIVSRAKFAIENYGRILESQTVIIVQTSYLRSVDLHQLRAQIRSSGVYLKHVRNAELKSTLEAKGLHALSKTVCGPTMLVYSDEELPKVKEAFEIVSKNRKLLILSGKVAGKLWTVEALKDIIYNTPSKKELQNQLLSILEQSAHGIIGTISNPLNHISMILSRRK